MKGWRIHIPSAPVCVVKGHYYEFTRMGGVWTDRQGNVLDNQKKPKRVWAALEREIERREKGL